jgi:hypothetical protein
MKPVFNWRKLKAYKKISRQSVKVAAEPLINQTVSGNF